MHCPEVLNIANPAVPESGGAGKNPVVKTQTFATTDPLPVEPVEFIAKQWIFLLGASYNNDTLGSVQLAKTMAFSRFGIPAGTCQSDDIVTCPLHVQKPNTEASDIAMKLAEFCKNNPYVPNAGEFGISKAENVAHPILLFEVVKVMRLPFIEYPVTYHAYALADPTGVETPPNEVGTRYS